MSLTIKTCMIQQNPSKNLKDSMGKIVKLLVSVMDWMFMSPQNSYVEILTSIRRWGFWMVIKS